MAKNAEIKCPSCQTWVENKNNRCTSCGSVLDRNELIRIERENRNGKVIIEKKTGAIERFLIRTENSENAFVIIFRNIIRMVWLVYMGVLGFFIWFIAWMAG